MTISAILPRAAFASSLALAKDVVGRRSLTPVLGSIKIGAAGDDVFVDATDEDIFLRVRLPDAIADRNFVVALPAHTTADVNRKAPATDFVEIDAQEEANGAALVYGDLRVHMGGVDHAEFPVIEIDGAINAAFSIPREDLLGALESVAFAMSSEETRYYLNGVFVHVATDSAGGEVLRFVATDGHRMALHDLPAPEGAGLPGSWSAIIPRKTVAFMIKVLSAKNAGAVANVMVNCTKARFTVGDVDVITPLVDGTFPDYGRVVPANDHTVRMQTSEMIRAIKAVTAISIGPVRLDVGPDRINLVRNSTDDGRAEMSVPCSADVGPGLYIGFNPKYLLDILDELGGDVINAHIQDYACPAVFEREGKPTRYVLMPMRV